MFKGIERFEFMPLFLDFYQPNGMKQSITIVNSLWIEMIPMFPLLILTPFFNPYRSYQFYFKLNHAFIKGFKLEDIINQEKRKRKDILRLFKESLTDFLTLLMSLIIILTGFRAIYLLAILSVNGHVTRLNPFLERMTEGRLKLWMKL